MTFEIKLSANGLSNVSSIHFEEDFCIAMRKRKYYINRFFASYISPVIAKNMLNDPTFDTFSIDLDDKKGHFGDFLTLLKGKPIIIDESNFASIIAIAKCLGNDEIKSLVGEGILKFEELSIKNCVRRFLKKRKYSMNISDEMEYIALNFSSIPKKYLYKLSHEDLFEFLASKHLKIEDESWLLEFLIEVINRKGNSYRYLLSTLAFEMLNTTEMERFISFITCDDISGAMWQALCRRLKMSVKQRTPNENNKSITYNPTQFELGEDKFDGIFASMYKQNHKNPNKNGVVEITSSSVYGTKLPLNVFEPDTISFFESTNEENPWLRFDFKENRINLSNYSLMTVGMPENADDHIKSWVVEGSNDGENWDVLDEHKDNYDLNGRLLSHTYSLENNDKTFKFIQIRGTGFTHCASSQRRNLMLGRVEFFGTLFMKL